MIPYCSDSLTYSTVQKIHFISLIEAEDDQVFAALHESLGYFFQCFGSHFEILGELNLRMETETSCLDGIAEHGAPIS